MHHAPARCLQGGKAIRQRLVEDDQRIGFTVLQLCRRDRRRTGLNVGKYQSPQDQNPHQHGERYLIFHEPSLQ